VIKSTTVANGDFMQEGLAFFGDLRKVTIEDKSVLDLRPLITDGKLVPSMVAYTKD
jgi:hypothetical protein